MGGQVEGGLSRAKAPESQVQVLEFQSLGVLVHDVSKVNISHIRQKLELLGSPLKFHRKA
jgi:hypothetical protein